MLGRLALAVVGVAAAGSIAAADPLELAAMDGPYPTLRTFCERTVLGAAGLLVVGECPISKVTPLDAPWSAGTFVRFDVHAGEPMWYAAIFARDGWYVTDVPICSGRGCEPFIGPIAMFDTDGGPQLAKFSAGWLQPERPGPIPYSLEQRVDLICAPGSGAAPACTSVPVKIAITQDTDPDAAPRTRIAARTNLRVAARWRSDRLVLRVSGTHRVTGHNREATGWRKTIASIVGRHVLPLP